ncbi:MAG: deoxyhypusine synthase family protein [Candidatus Bathyarchaeota archaeon]
MKHVKQILIKPQMTVGQLVDEMGQCGVLGAGQLAKAVNIMIEIMEKPEYTTFLCVAGPMVPGGLRGIISLLIEKGYIDAIVVSGGNIVHDMIEAFGYQGDKGSFSANDVKLRTLEVGRAGNIFFNQKGFQVLEKRTYEIFNSINSARANKEDETEMAIYELLNEIGKTLNDENSFLKKASMLNIPVFSPAIMDSMLGLHIWTFNQLKKLKINPVLDLNRMADIIFSSKKLSAIILGGSVPKHFVLGASTLREGVDAAVQITMDRPEGGSLSGAPLEEAISWKKAKTESKLATVIGDATIIFPFMVAAVLEKLNKGINSS